MLLGYSFFRLDSWALISGWLFLFGLVPFFWVLVELIRGISTPCNIFSDLLLFCQVSSPKISVYIWPIKTLMSLAPKNLWWFILCWLCSVRQEAKGLSLFPCPGCQGLQHYRTQDLREKVPLAESKWHRENKGRDSVEFSGTGSWERWGPQGKRMGSDVDSTE